MVKKVIKSGLLIVGGFMSGWAVKDFLLCRYLKSELALQEKRKQGKEYSWDNLKFNSKDGATDALNTLNDVLDAYGMVSIADLYSTADVDLANYKDINYGWRSLETAKVVKSKSGFEILFPQVELLTE